jgi:hypothetical protein
MVGEEGLQIIADEMAESFISPTNIALLGELSSHFDESGVFELDILTGKYKPAELRVDYAIEAAEQYKDWFETQLRKHHIQPELVLSLVVILDIAQKDGGQEFSGMVQISTKENKYISKGSLSIQPD